MIGEKAKSILLVDDEFIITLDEKRSLEEYGYRVTTADSGEKAVAALAAGADIDLILMDINLGRGMDGTEAAELILKDHDIPVVFLSSHTEPEIVEKTERISSYGYVVKSSTITVLDASIKMAFKLFDANRKTKAANNKLNATLGAIPDLLFEVGLDGRYYDIHAPNTGFLYKTAEARTGKTLFDVLPPEVSEIVHSALQEAAEKGFSFGRHYQLDVPAGRRWFEISASPVAGSPSEPHFIYLCRDITGRKRGEEKIRRLLEEKELVLKEVNHRIKNNMGSMMSLLSMQSSAVSDPGFSAILRDAENRLRSMGVLYDKLYQSDNLLEISARDYLSTLAQEIVAGFPNAPVVEVEARIDDFVLGIDKVSPLGILYPPWGSS